MTIPVAYRTTTGGISVNYGRNVGRVSCDSRARVDRLHQRQHTAEISVWR